MPKICRALIVFSLINLLGTLALAYCRIELNELGSLPQPVKKIRVGILFGGRSAEHEVSLNSAKNIISAIDKTKYEPVLIGIDKQGQWHLNSMKEFLANTDASGRPILQRSERPLAIEEFMGKVDVIFPVLHGTYGEDGTMQGLLKLMNIPFVGCGVIGSAVGMDKDFMKRLFRDAGLPLGKFVVAQKHRPVTFEEAVQEVGIPFFIKPANAGSSVGVHKIKSKADYETAMADAFQFDHKIIVEEFIKGREIEVAVLGNLHPEASVPGEIIPTHEFYSYDAKYLDPNGAGLAIPAKLDPGVSEEIRKLAIDVFQVLGSEGLGRVDFFLTPDNRIFVNEINTLPGFTSVSMYPQLWGASGLPYPDLIDRLIGLALERHERDSRLKTSIEL